MGPAIWVRVVITDRVRCTTCEFCSYGKDDEGFVWDVIVIITSIFDASVGQG